LEEAEADGDVVVVMAVEVGLFVYAEEAEVAELELDAVICWRMAGAVGVTVVVRFRAILVCHRGGWRERFWFSGVEVAIREAVEVHAGVITEEIRVAWTGAVDSGAGVAVFGGRAAMLEAEEGEKAVG
jgi:hypothetical protein